MATLSARQPSSGDGAASGTFGLRPFDRAAILERFPWLAPNDEPALLIIGDDLDAALSAALFLHTHPRAQLAGVYHEYRRIHHAAGPTWEQLLDGLWLDLDIYHPQVRSLGHHITRLDPGEPLPGFVHNCNPNTLAGISRQHFRHKYPLGTIHFLLWLYAVEIPAHPHAEALIWLADSAYINGQTQIFKNGTPRAGFRWNVAEWLQVVLPLPSLLRSFAALDTPEFEQRMAALHRRMAQRGFVQGTDGTGRLAASAARRLSMSATGRHCALPPQPARLHRAAHRLDGASGTVEPAGEGAPHARGTPRAGRSRRGAARGTEALSRRAGRLLLRV